MTFPFCRRWFRLVVISFGLALVGCDREGPRTVTVVWKDEKAVALQIHDVSTDDQLQVRLVNNPQPILGDYSAIGVGVQFTPPVPLTRGLKYEVLIDTVVIARIEIPTGDLPVPEVVAMYPRSDTVPENLLKVYLRFSQPMAEGKSAEFVHLLKDGYDTMKGTFLDLQPELWNAEGTVLTLWLDPGRIKLDLIPNKELGNPLTQGVYYELRVATGWKSKSGVPLDKNMFKQIYVGKRDDKSPDVLKWGLGVPKSGSREPLLIDFHEPMDRMLLESAFQVLGPKGEKTEATFEPFDDDRQMKIVPVNTWQNGTYKLQVESRLEDLAGNNLNRLFEVDLNRPAAGKTHQSIYTRAFMVK